MTLKAIKQFTNTAWIIGGVAGATGGYSYLNTFKAETFHNYKRKPLGTISSIDDIEDWENQKGCQFLFFTKREIVSNRRADDLGQDGRVVRETSIPIQASSSAVSSPIVKTAAAAKPAAKANYSGLPRYNEFFQGGVLNARNYIGEDELKKDKVIKKAEAMKSKCERGKIVYEEIEDTKTAVINDPQGS